jgi:hypothetical protein
MHLEGKRLPRKAATYSKLIALKEEALLKQYQEAEKQSSAYRHLQCVPSQEYCHAKETAW